MRSSKWLSNIILTSRASFCSCNSKIKSIGVSKTSNNLTFKKSTHSKLCSRNTNDASKIRESDKTKNAMLPKVKADFPSEKFSPGVQLSARNSFKSIRAKKLHFKQNVKPYNSKKNTQELLAKIINSQRVNELATKTLLTGSLKSPESCTKDSLKSKDTERGLKSINGILKEANDIRYKLNAKREGVGIYQNMLKYNKGFDEHVRVNPNKTKVDDTAVNSMINVRPTPDKSSIKKYQPKNTEGPSNNLNLTSQKKYGKNKAEEVSTKMKNPYYSFQPTVSPKKKDAKLMMWLPFDQQTDVNQKRLKKAPIKIKLLPDRKEETGFNYLDGFQGKRTEESIKTFPKKVLKYNLKTEESKVYNESKNTGEPINKESINPKDDLLKNNENTSITDKPSDVVVNPKYLENVKDKFFTKKDRVVMIGPIKNHSKSNKQRYMTYEKERKIKHKNEVRHPEKNVLVELWKTSRMTLPESTKKKNFIKTRRIRAAMPSTAAQLLKHPDRSPRKIAYLKKLNNTTNANSNVKIPKTTTLVEDYNSETTPIQWVDVAYVNPFNSFKTNIHRQFNENNKWSSYTKYMNRKSKYPNKSAGDVTYINSLTKNLQEDKNELDSVCNDNITSSSNLSTNLKTNKNRVWISDVYKEKTSPVDPLLCSQKKNDLTLPLTARKLPMFVVQKPSIKVHKKTMKTKAINSDTLVLGKNTKKDGSKYLNTRYYMNNGDKCPSATKLPKKIEPEKTFLNAKKAENNITTVKVLSCPKMKKEPTSEVLRNQERSVLPADMEDEWTKNLNWKSRSDLINRYSTETQFFNDLLSRSLASYYEVYLDQTPNPEPTVVKDTTDKYVNERQLKASIIPHVSNEENHLDLRKAFSRYDKTPSYCDIQSTEPEVEDLTEPHQQPDSAETTEDSTENPYDDETTNDISYSNDAIESSQNKSIQLVVQNVFPETTNTLVPDPEPSEECRWTEQMETPKIHQRWILKPIPTIFSIANICRTSRPSSNKGVVVLKPTDIPVAMENL